MILPRELAKSLGNISQLVLVKQIAASIQVMDPFTCEVYFVCVNNWTISH